MPSTKCVLRQMRYWLRLRVSDEYAPTGKANRIADWIEVECLVRERAVGGDELASLATAFGYRSTDVGLGLTTMSRRLALLGAPVYPFRVASGAAAVPAASEQPWVALLLMSSESPARPLMNLPQAAEQLERITVEAVKGLFGPGTSAVRFAWPSEDGRPAEFPDAIRWLAARMNVRIGSAYRPPYRKDGGVDVVAWRPFPDGRSGFPVLLAQCTLERRYSSKAADVDTRIWSGWLALDVDPATALSVPDVVPVGEEWNTLAARTVILDRIRLASLIGQRPANGLLASSRSWAVDALAKVREARW